MILILRIVIQKWFKYSTNIPLFLNYLSYIVALTVHPSFLTLLQFMYVHVKQHEEKENQEFPTFKLNAINKYLVK